VKPATDEPQNRLIRQSHCQQWSPFGKAAG
jgi:hypothetical protein